MSSHSQAFIDASNRQQNEQLLKQGCVIRGCSTPTSGRVPRERPRAVKVVTSRLRLDLGAATMKQGRHIFFDGGNTSPLPELKCGHAANFEQLA